MKKKSLSAIFGFVMTGIIVFGIFQGSVCTVYANEPAALGSPSPSGAPAQQPEAPAPTYQPASQNPLPTPKKKPTVDNTPTAEQVRQLQVAEAQSAYLAGMNATVAQIQNAPAGSLCLIEGYNTLPTSFVQAMDSNPNSNYVIVQSYEGVQYTTFLEAGKPHLLRDVSYLGPLAVADVESQYVDGVAAVVSRDLESDATTISISQSASNLQIIDTVASYENHIAGNERSESEQQALNYLKRKLSEFLKK